MGRWDEQSCLLSDSLSGEPRGSPPNHLPPNRSPPMTCLPEPEDDFQDVHPEMGGEGRFGRGGERGIRQMGEKEGGTVHGGGGKRICLLPGGMEGGVEGGMEMHGPLKNPRPLTSWP